MLWAISCYFNPAGYERRRLAFDAFRQALDIPLLVVEQSLNGLQEVSSSSAEIVLQASGGDAMWQKERLLNIALDALPSECDQVAWLDCDILFEDRNWFQSLETKLGEVPLVQLFRDVKYLDPGWEPGLVLEEHVERVRPSIVSGISSGLGVGEALEAPSPDQRPGTYANGMAWAANREFIEKYRFYDACIIGGGDRAITCAAYGCFDHIFEWHSMNEAQQAYYLQWAIPFYQGCQGRTACLDTDIYHQWHGKASDRGLLSRHEGLRPFDFDPFTDISIDMSGCWRWNSRKPDMHHYFSQYFNKRREDG